ncbi:MAG: T9SS type A sorting domain-containing protein [Cyclonatronaceae bacterium]
MKYSFILPILLMASGMVRAQPTDSLEYALSFYPIQIGNQWDYYDDGSYHVPPTQWYTRIEVVQDTLINEKQYQVLKHNGWVKEHWIDPDLWDPYPAFYTYERIDSSTGNVYAWARHFDEPQEVLIDSLLAMNDLTRIESNRLTYRWQSSPDFLSTTLLVNVSTRMIFNQEYEIRYYEQEILNAPYYELAKGIGLLVGAFYEIVYARINGEEFGERLLTSLEEPGERPLAVRLLPNYPNPFNPSTTLRYDLDEPGPVRLEVFDLTGRRVALLADDHTPAGHHTAVFNATGLASGFYIARLTTRGAVQHRKMLLVR